MLLLRAAFCHPWDSIVLFYGELKEVELFKEKMKSYADFFDKPMPTVKCSQIPRLDRLHSLSQFAIEINSESMDKAIEVKEDDILFYSGTVLHLRCLATLLNFRTMLTYDDEKGFLAIGEQKLRFLDISLTLEAFLGFNRAFINESKVNITQEYISIQSISNRWSTKSKYLKKVEYINDILHINWAKPPTSNQRKIIAKDCHLLKQIFGHYSIAHHNLPPSVERLMRYRHNFEFMEG